MCDQDRKAQSIAVGLTLICMGACLRRLTGMQAAAKGLGDAGEEIVRYNLTDAQRAEIDAARAEIEEGE